MMAGRTKKRQQKRRWAASPTAPLRALVGSIPFDEAEQTKLQLPGHMAYEALRTGKASEEAGDFDTLAIIANVCLVRAEQIDKVAKRDGRSTSEADFLVPVVQDAQEALMHIQARGIRAGRMVATGPELQALATMLDIHDQLVANSTPRQMELALREVAVRMRRQQVYRLEVEP
jgi:hypothetical protein